MYTRTKRRTLSTLILLGFILCVAAYLRFFHLTSIPPSLSHDETAIAYNAFSLLTTGKDEYGTSFPLLFKSFDDYKLPGMVYSTIPFIALFGRSELAARLPSALYGLFAVLIMYGIAIELLEKKRYAQIASVRVDLALFPALLFALSPWHVNFSRQLFESNGAVFWFMLGTYFLLRSTKRYGDILWAGLSYVVSLYFYYSVRLVIPFVGVVYLIRYYPVMTKHWKTTAATLVLCMLALLPLGVQMFSPGGLERISIVSVVNDPNYIRLRDAYVARTGTTPGIVDKIIYNRRIALVRTVIDNYAKNISPHNLFVTGTGTYGALFPFEALLVPLGLVMLATLSKFPRLIVWVWLIAAFLPGALSTKQPNTLRTLVAAPAFALLSGLGVAYLVTRMKEKAGMYIGAVSFSVLALWFLFAFPRFHYAYFVDNPTNNAVAFADGNKQMVTYVTAHQNEYDRIYISGYYWRPYIFMLYWGNTDPALYQTSGSRERFGKYIFTGASWDTNGIKLMDPEFDPAILPHDGKTLFILSTAEYTLHAAQFTPVAQIHGRMGETVFTAAVLQ